MTRCAYTTVSAVCSCMFLCVPVRREFRVLVHILRYDSCALSVSFEVFILCALCVCTCELHARVDSLCTLYSLLRSAFSTPYSALHSSLHSALFTPLCTLYSQLRSAFRTLCSAVDSALYLSCVLFILECCMYSVMHLCISYDVFVYSLYSVPCPCILCVVPMYLLWRICAFLCSICVFSVTYLSILCAVSAYILCRTCVSFVQCLCRSVHFLYRVCVFSVPCLCNLCAMSVHFLCCLSD